MVKNSKGIYEVRDYDFLDLESYRVKSTEKEILDFFTTSPLLKIADLLDDADGLRFNDGKLSFFNMEVNAYFASVAADFIRHKLIEHSKSFTFETVMSFTDKIEFLQKAQLKGYQTYLYPINLKKLSFVQSLRPATCSALLQIYESAV